MNKNQKELEKVLNELANDFVEHNYKKEAFKEIEEAEKGGFKFPNTATIVNNYLDFDTVQLNITSPNQFHIKIAMTPELVKNNPKVVKKLVKMFGKFYKGE